MESKITIFSWNINGLRSGLKKGFLNWIETFKPKILCLQEIRTDDKDLIKDLHSFLGYNIFFNSAKRKGYSGTALITLETPLNVSYSTEKEEFDNEGRYILAEFKNYTIINCYVPNGRANTRVDFKIKFLDFLLSAIKKHSTKPLVICGDFNIAHKKIDLHNPSQNKTKTGFLEIERVFFDRLISIGYIDVFRNFFPEENGYTWWNQSGKFKQLDLGWRFDYIWVHKKYYGNIRGITRFPENTISDHCPLKIEIDFT